ncbi:tRNA (5-methylaminomethyl-2-thiouridine)(34)-methyltransferase MnmD [Plebeiibacterium marinum]|uniref:tRNA (5-methylaminomethyl-2-thiouridine)(34)-methyltransferase MnmD n=1 Tax=Plebeiibacterium marinum TaxID=2992111 RepID=A0AAE3MFK5_9BACT|nr:tRNA (5-methylaminomethyl-2-thiouridine)(34)-methyltransferase MnmD [Plebeiobacterium marinum]MCW3806670.1 tRNA (5-methylaminomethyl-2-thiouridine)(34)-methyltransferase MnmD [Plebeiobacterium marinum]
MSQQQKIITSEDGSHTIFVPDLDEHYHSTHGAIQESMHVFIEAGLKQIQKKEISILEFGFGTGLNAFLTSINSADKKIYYHTLEKYPIDISTANKLNYKTAFEGKYTDIFIRLHEAEWEKETDINKNFRLLKTKCDFKNALFNKKYDLIYFDAFAPEKQPLLWSKDIFQKTYDALNKSGILTTYCAKGVVRRLMQEIGFKVERIPGPPGKREMIRAIKH